jgi:hypothetical protein
MGTQDDAPDHIIWIKKVSLDDGFVYDVVFGNTTLHAVTEMEAYDMADAIKDAINDHSTSTADVLMDE